MTRDRALQKAREIVLAHHHYMCKGCQEMIAAALLEAYAEGAHTIAGEIHAIFNDTVEAAEAATAEAEKLRGGN